MTALLPYAFPVALAFGLGSITLTIRDALPGIRALLSDLRS